MLDKQERLKINIIIQIRGGELKMQKRDEFCNDKIGDKYPLFFSAQIKIAAKINIVCNFMVTLEIGNLFF